jgi:Tol biopolymer transport system component
MLEFATGVSTRLGFDAASMSAVWSPDGKYVAWFRPGGIYREAANGAGENQLLLKTDLLSFPKSWSPDGRYLIYAQVSPATGSADLFALAVAGDQGQLVLAATPANEGQASVRPTGAGWHTPPTNRGSAKST